MDKEKITSYKDLIVWQKSLNLAELIYKITENFPKVEMFGLTSQMRRCAVSIPSNIAEGKGRGTKKDYRQFIIIAYGSASELETQVILAKKFGYLDDKQLEQISNLLEEIMKMLGTLNKRLGSND